MSVTVLAALDEAPTIQKGGCNLSNRKAEYQTEPAMMLGREMLAIAQNFTHELFVTGSYDAESDDIHLDQT